MDGREGEKRERERERERERVLFLGEIKVDEGRRTAASGGGGGGGGGEGGGGSLKNPDFLLRFLLSIVKNRWTCLRIPLRSSICYVPSGGGGGGGGGVGQLQFKCWALFT